MWFSFSSLHETDAINKSTGEQQKTEVITFYNTTKAGVDTADQTFSESEHKMLADGHFFACMYMTALNSQVISTRNGLEPL